jgi:hypothetical protein
MHVNRPQLESIRESCRNARGVYGILISVAHQGVMILVAWSSHRAAAQACV